MVTVCVNGNKSFQICTLAATNIFKGIYDGQAEFVMASAVHLFPVCFSDAFSTFFAFPVQFKNPPVEMKFRVIMVSLKNTKSLG